MNGWRTARRALWIAVAVAGALLAALLLGWWQVDGPGAPQTAATTDVQPLGGAFAMTDHRGRPFTERDLGGRPTLMFFGFTACPDICPTTLSDVSRWLAELGADAEKVNAIFVTVDPERDGVARMAEYLTAFDGRIVGLTGTPDQLAAMAAAYRFFYEKVETGGDYTMNHTASLYLLDRDALLVGTVDYHEASETALQKIRRLIGS